MMKRSKSLTPQKIIAMRWITLVYRLTEKFGSRPINLTLSSWTKGLEQDIVAGKFNKAYLEGWLKRILFNGVYKDDEKYLEFCAVITKESEIFFEDMRQFVSEFQLICDSREIMNRPGYDHRHESTKASG